MKLLPKFLVPAFLALILIGTASAQPAGGYIQDEAGLFSSNAVVEADLKIDTLYDKTHVALWVRTLKKLPESVEASLRGKSSKVQAQHFKSFALELAEKEGRTGIYVLISDDPHQRHSVVVLHPQEVGDLISMADVNALRLLFSSRRLQKQSTADLTLAEGVEKVQYLLYTRSTETNISWPLIGAVACGLLGLWLLLGLLRMRVARQTLSPGDTIARRNNFVGGLLGGMFGGVAGHWIYDTLFNRGTPQAPVPTTGGGDTESTEGGSSNLNPPTT